MLITDINPINSSINLGYLLLGESNHVDHLARDSDGKFLVANGGLDFSK